MKTRKLIAKNSLYDNHAIEQSKTNANDIDNDDEIYDSWELDDYHLLTNWETEHNGWRLPATKERTTGAECGTQRDVFTQKVIQHMTIKYMSNVTSVHAFVPPVNYVGRNG